MHDKKIKKIIKADLKSLDCPFTYRDIVNQTDFFTNKGNTKPLVCRLKICFFSLAILFICCSFIIGFNVGKINEKNNKNIPTFSNDGSLITNEIDDYIRKNCDELISNVLFSTEYDLFYKMSIYEGINYTENKRIFFYVIKIDKDCKEELSLNFGNDVYNLNQEYNYGILCDENQIKDNVSFSISSETFTKYYSFSK